MAKQRTLNRDRREGLLSRWSRFAAHRRWGVVAGWVVGLILATVLNFSLGNQYVDNFSMPGAESQEAIDLLDKSFPAQAGDSATIVFQSETGFTDPDVQQQIQAVVDESAAIPGVVYVDSPLDNPQQISASGQIAYATVHYDTPAIEAEASAVEPLLDIADAASTERLYVQAGGEIVAAFEEPEPGSAEAIGFLVALMILLVAFGSIVAAGMPLVTALFGLISGLMLVGISTVLFDIPTFTPILLSMIGIGVGIDYTLFIITRFRENLRHGDEWEDAIAHAMNTAGRAVIFAGTVVIIAMAGLIAIQIPLFTAVGVSAAIIVAVAILVSVTLVPALMGFARGRIDKWSLPFVSQAAPDAEQALGYRLAGYIQRRPLIWAAGAAAILILLTLPVLDIWLGFSDAGNRSEELRTRQTYDLLAEGFGPGFNGPLLFVVDQPDGYDEATIAALSQELQNTDGIVSVGPAIPNDDGAVAVMTAIPAYAPQASETSDLVNSLRSDVIPAAISGTAVTVLVTGPTAAVVDVNALIIDRMPLFMGIVIGLSMLLLMVVFRSIVIPIKAALMNLLSIGAAMGVVVAVFQWGWGASIFSVNGNAPIESFIPIMAFAILFGLSMDYEVFLMSRIHENYLKTGDNSYSVRHGVGSTSRVIAAAAAIMVSVFLTFAILGGDRVAAMFGLGLAVAIFVDATIIRLILVPALMELFGNWNWWLPGWMERRLPRINVEGFEGEPQAAPALD